METRLSPQGKFLVATLANHVTPTDCREFTSRDTADNYVMEEMSKTNLSTAVFTAAW